MSYRFRVSEVTIGAGQTHKVGDLVLVIGPNNVGKSQLLRDLAKSAAELNTPRTVLKQVVVELPTNLDEFLEKYPIEEDEVQVEGRPGVQLSWLDGDLNGRVTKNADSKWREQFAKNRVMYPDVTPQEWHTYFFGSRAVARMATDNRLTMLKATKWDHRHKWPSNLLQQFYAAGLDVERKLNTAIAKHFGREIRLDYSLPGQLGLRVATAAELSRVPTDPREAFQFYQRAKTPMMDQQGDGLRSFTAVMLALLCSGKAVLMLDEPEISLHPGLVRELAQQVCSATGPQAGMQIFASTHSAEFLSEAVKHSSTATVIRLSRKGDATTATFVNTKAIVEFGGHAVLGANKILEGLFHSNVIVTEGHTDAKFISAAMRRLGLPDAYVVDTNGKTDVAKCVRFYRSSGIHVGAFVDFDILNDEVILRSALEAFEVPSEKVSAWFRLRALMEAELGASTPSERLSRAEKHCKDLWGVLSQQNLPSPKLNDTVRDSRKILGDITDELDRSVKPWSEAKVKGIAAFSTAVREQFNALSEDLLSRGLAIWPTGELESITDKLNVSREPKNRWLASALAQLNLLGEEPLQDYPFDVIRRIAEELARARVHELDPRFL